MSYFFPLLVLCFCLPVVYLPATKVRLVLWLTLAALVLGAIGCSWPYFMPTNFLVDHPWAVDSPLHPSLSIFWGGICLLFAMGLSIALGCRATLLYMKVMKQR